jgi:arylsulfatase A-like enzyme
LLITIDTLRADALIEQDTPALLELKARGTTFARARTPAPLTLPAHATLLSGLSPKHHRLRDNTALPLPSRERRSFPLLAEEFVQAGYATAAFVASSVLDPRYGLGSGFEQYRHPELPRKGQPAFPSRDAAEQVELVRRWLAARPKERPFFVWVHLWEPHAPYRPYAGDERRPGTDGDLDPPATLYRGEVRKADAAVEALLGMVEAATTLVVVTSDHGESLGEHEESTHGHLCYGATMDVPLILAGPGVAQGAMDQRVCTLEDLAPTIRRVCGLDSRPADGLSLLDRAADRVVVGESLYAHRQFGWAQQAVAFDGGRSLVDGGPRLELFDLAADPGETNALSDPASRPEIYEKLDRAIRAYQAAGERTGGTPYSAGSPYAAGTPYSAGSPYAAGSPYGSQRILSNAFLRPADNRRLRDVRKSLPISDFLSRFRAAVAVGDKALLLKLRPELERLEREDRSNPALPFALGRALLFVLDDPSGAAGALERAFEKGYRSPEAEALLERARALRNR